MGLVALSDGAMLHATVEGEGPDLVLISGLGGLAAFWDPFVQSLGGGIRVTRFDQRGIGGSARGTKPISIETLAEDSWEALDALGIENPVLSGHSTGGAIIQRMVLDRPGMARGLILNGTWARPNQFMSVLFEGRLELLARDPAKYARLSALVGYPPRWLEEHPAILDTPIIPDAALAQVMRERIHAILRHDLNDHLPEMTLPCLVIGAEDDMIVPPYLQEELAAGLPDVSLHLYPSGGHFYPVTQVNDLAARTRQWITALG